MIWGMLHVILHNCLCKNASTLPKSSQQTERNWSKRVWRWQLRTSQAKKTIRCYQLLSVWASETSQQTLKAAVWKKHSTESVQPEGPLYASSKNFRLIIQKSTKQIKLRLQMQKEARQRDWLLSEQGSDKCVTALARKAYVLPERLCIHTSTCHHAPSGRKERFSIEHRSDKCLTGKTEQASGLEWKRRTDASTCPSAQIGWIKKNWTKKGSDQQWFHHSHGEAVRMRTCAAYEGADMRMCGCAEILTITSPMNQWTMMISRKGQVVGSKKRLQVSVYARWVSFSPSCWQPPESQREEVDWVQESLTGEWSKIVWKVSDSKKSDRWVFATALDHQEVEYDWTKDRISSKSTSALTIISILTRDKGVMTGWRKIQSQDQFKRRMCAWEIQSVHTIRCELVFKMDFVKGWWLYALPEMRMF